MGGDSPPKFEVGDGPCLRLPKYFGEILFIIRNVHILPIISGYNLFDPLQTQGQVSAHGQNIITVISEMHVSGIFYYLCIFQLILQSVVSK